MLVVAKKLKKGKKKKKKYTEDEKKCVKFLETWDNSFLKKSQTMMKKKGIDLMKLVKKQ